VLAASLALLSSSFKLTAVVVLAAMSTSLV
jgi:hypothetical protein